MALSTTDTIAIHENALDSAAQQYRDPDMKVDALSTDADLYYGSLTLYDSAGNATGAQTFLLTVAELIAQEATFAAAYAIYKAAVQKAVKARLLAIPANGGVTITYT